MNKKILFIIAAAIVLIALAAGGYFYWKKVKTSPQAEKSDTERVTESATQGVLPSIQTNPFEDKPDLNPADKANPYKDIKTNPFQ